MFEMMMVTGTSSQQRGWAWFNCQLLTYRWTGTSFKTGSQSTTEVQVRLLEREQRYDYWREK